MARLLNVMLYGGLIYKCIKHQRRYLSTQSHPRGATPPHKITFIPQYLYLLLEYNVAAFPAMIRRVYQS